MKNRRVQHVFETRSTQINDLERDVKDTESRLNWMNNNTMGTVKMADQRDTRLDSLPTSSEDLSSYTSNFNARHSAAFCDIPAASKNYRRETIKLKSRLKKKLSEINTLKDDLHEKEAELVKIQKKNKLEEIMLGTDVKLSESPVMEVGYHGNERVTGGSITGSAAGRMESEDLEPSETIETQLSIRAESRSTDTNFQLIKMEKLLAEKNRKIEQFATTYQSKISAAESVAPGNHEEVEGSERQVSDITKCGVSDGVSPTCEDQHLIELRTKMDGLIADKTKEIDHLKDANKKLTHDCDVFYEKMIQKCAMMQQDYTALKDEHARTAEKQSDSDAIIADLKLTLAQELQQSKSIKKKQMASHREFDEMQSALCEKEKELKMLECACETNDGEISALKERQIHNGDGEYGSDLEDTLAAKEKTLAALQKEYERLNTDFTALQKQYDIKTKELCDEIEVMRREVVSKSDEVADLKKVCEQNESESVAFIEGQNEKHGKLLSLKQQEIELLTKEKLELEAKCAESTASQNLKQNEFNNLQQLYNTLQEELATLTIAHQTDTDDMLAQLTSLQSLLDERDAELAEKERACIGFESLKGEFRAKQDKMSTMAKELVNAHRRLSVIPEDIMQIRQLVEQQQQQGEGEVVVSPGISNVDISVYEMKESDRYNDEVKDDVSEHSKDGSDKDIVSECSEIKEEVEIEYSSDSSVISVSASDSDNSSCSATSKTHSDIESERGSGKSVSKNDVDYFDDDFFGISKSKSPTDLHEKTREKEMSRTDLNSDSSGSDDSFSLSKKSSSSNRAKPMEKKGSRSDVSPKGSLSELKNPKTGLGDLPPLKLNKSPSTGHLGELPPLVSKTPFSNTMNGNNILGDIPVLSSNKAKDGLCGSDRKSQQQGRDFSFTVGGGDEKSISDGECVEESIAEEISDFEDEENDIANILDNL